MRLPGPKIALPVLILLLGALVAVGLVQGRKPPKRVTRPTPPPVVRVATVEITSTQVAVDSQGQVAPRTETTIVAQVAGQIVEVSPSLVAGGFFDANETLAKIEGTDFRLALKTAEAGVATAELRIAREEKEAEIARRDWADLGSGSPDPLVLREPQLAEARAVLASSEALVEKARVDLNRTRIRVPYDGRVREKLVDVGQFVARGTPIARVYATDAAEIRLPVPADQIEFLDLSLDGRPTGDHAPSVRLRADFGGEWREWTGRVTRTEGEIDPRTRMVTAVARVDDPYGEGAAAGGTPLAVGLFVEAAIEGRTFDGVVVLPREALHGPDAVLVVDAEDRLHIRPVDVLRVDRESALLRSGLREGELVCLSQIDVVVDGMRVRVERPGAEAQAGGGRQPAAAEITDSGADAGGER